MLKNKLKNKKLIIFDLDDTLIISHINYQRLREEVLKFLDIGSKDELMKKPISELLNILEAENPSDIIKALVKIKELENSYSNNAEIIELADTIPEILNNYDFFYAILTNNTRDSLKSYLNNPSFKFLKKFYILTRDEAKMKPDPEGIIKIIHKFKNQGIIKENSLYIGDSFIDANASFNAGINFVHFHSRDVDLSQFRIKPEIVLRTWKNFENFVVDIK
ncbi:MAG: Phosphoglycolate phosphatase [Candidatus Heimdallarchaeota archaeon LC_3]|nr:MAG: Phosphoglycolate phosphatase [Candidatus Heimdallarchaeota archaeon LC_3]